MKKKTLHSIIGWITIIALTIIISYIVGTNKWLGTHGFRGEIKK